MRLSLAAKIRSFPSDHSFPVCSASLTLAQVRHDGSGGIPSGAALVPENADTWAAPAPIGMSQNDGHHLGQIVGASPGFGLNGDLDVKAWVRAIGSGTKAPTARKKTLLIGAAQQ